MVVDPTLLITILGGIEMFAFWEKGGDTAVETPPTRTIVLAKLVPHILLQAERGDPFSVFFA